MPMSAAEIQTAPFAIWSNFRPATMAMMTAIITADPIRCFFSMPSRFANAVAAMVRNTKDSRNA